MKGARHAPVLPGMFDNPARAEVNRMRDEAMTTVAQHAEEELPAFGERARTFVLEFLRTHGPTAGEILTLRCKDAGIVPHDDRAFGPVYYMLARRGLIIRAGQVRRERGHGTSGGIVWSLRYPNPSLTFRGD